MKRSLKTAISLFLFLSFIAVLASCGIIQTYENIAVQGEVYSFGKQTIILNSILPEGGNAAKFKKDISASDIKLSDALEGKNIDKVTSSMNTILNWNFPEIQNQQEEMAPSVLSPCLRADWKARENPPAI